MLRHAAFALGTTVALGLPQVSVAQTVGQFIQAPVIGVQQPVITVRQPVALVAEPVVAVDRTTEQFARLPIAGSARDASECYSPDTDGPRNARALPLCLDYLQQADGAGQYDTLDRMTLADTRVCASGVNCGPPADLQNIRPFYGSAGAPVSQSVVQPVAVVRAAPVVLPPPVPAPVVLPPAPPLPTPVPVALPAVGFGGAGLALAGAAGLAALVGIIAVASDDDDDGVVSTASTN